MSRLNRRSFLGAAAALAAQPAAVASVDTSARKPAPDAPFKVGVAAYSFRQYLAGEARSMTLLEFIDLCARLGTDGVELTEYYFEKPVTREYLNRLKYRAHVLGQTICGTPVGNSFTHPAGEKREAELRRVREWIDVSADLGSPVIRVFAGSAPQGVSEAQARGHVVESLEALCEHAAARGVFLAVENHGGVVATADGLLEIVRAVQCPWVGINLDTGNFRTEDPYADLSRCAPYAVSVQYKVEMSVAGKREPADFARIVRILREARYRGFITLEYEAREDPKTAVPEHLRQIRKILGEPGTR